jgi:hypothetical protein
MGKTGAFVFVPERSTVTQGGGVAGVHEVYPIEGQFVLTVDLDRGTASLGPVDANLTRESPFLPGKVKVGDLFGMSELSGIIQEDGETVEFRGGFDDGMGGTAVDLTLSLTTEGANLTAYAQSPHCFDCFNFYLEAVARYAYGGGRGEPNNPYLIHTPEQLNAIGADPNHRDRHFKLTADVDLSAYTERMFSIIGNTYDTPFNGTFDGDGHEIRNLTIDRSSDECIGLFSTVGRSGRVKNLRLIDANVAGDTYVGALVGYSAGGVIENCYVTANVRGKGYTGGVAGISIEDALICDCRVDVRVVGRWYETGGIAGANSSSTITRCAATGAVTGSDSTGGVTGRQDWGMVSDSSSTCSVTGGRSTGGVAGRNAYSEISGCFATGDVSGGEVVGGLVGFSDSAVYDCWAGAKVSGASSVGGLIGQNIFGFVLRSYSRSVVESEANKGGFVGGQRGMCLYAGCFWDSEVDVLPPAVGSVAGIYAKPSGELKMESTFTQAGWDFVDETANGTEDIWRIDEGKDYPRLAWEHALSEDSGVED